MVSGSRVFSLSDRVSLQHLGENEGAVLLFVDSGQLFTCNDTTAEFLRAVDGKLTFSDIIANLESYFEVSHEELVQDLTNIAEQMMNEGIIH